MLLINRTGILQELHLPYWGWQLPPLHWLSAWLSSSLCCIKISLIESSACKRLQRQDAEVCQVITVTALSASFSHTFQDTYNVEMLKNCRMKASVFLNYFAFLPKCFKACTQQHSYISRFISLLNQHCCVPNRMALGENSHPSAYTISLHSSTLACWSKTQENYSSDSLYAFLNNILSMEC